MQIFHYDRETGEYTGMSEARKSPLDDAWLIPANATAEAPPATKDGEAAVFDGKWSIVEDNRGKTAYSTVDASKTMLTELGPVPDGYTLLEPVVSFPKWADSKWEEDTDAKSAATEAATKAALLDLDMKSIRSIREWAAKQADAPEILKTHEANAQAERAKLSTQKG